MLFNSFEFLAFFSVFLILFFASPQANRGLILLAASYIFYMGWRPAFALLLLLTTLVDYTTALIIDSSANRRWRRFALISALTINLGILGCIKYLDFALTNIAGLAGIMGIHMPSLIVGFVLPVGISFYTFQSIGYTLDVYAGRVRAERNLLVYAQYVSFFPQLVAGPIERAHHMLPQFRAERFTTPDQISTGLWLVGYGLFKKMCVADLIAPFVRAIFDRPQAFNGSYALLATVFFAVQIYCDFSGYSSIARGIARIMGYRLMVNFQQPYFSLSLTEFWRRWHISLSTWFRDYLYFPLGGNRVSKARWAFNLMVVFVVSGIWHGAAWTFALWGALHGVGLVVERFAQDHFGSLRTIRHRLGRFAVPLGWTWTMAIVLAGWVFFRAANLGDALAIFRAFGHPGKMAYGAFKLAGLASFECLLVALFIPLLLAADWMVRFHQDTLAQLRRNQLVNLGAGMALMYAIILFGVFGHVDFIYFRF